MIMIYLLFCNVFSSSFVGWISGTIKYSPSKGSDRRVWSVFASRFFLWIRKTDQTARMRLAEWTGGRIYYYLIVSAFDSAVLEETEFDWEKGVA